MVGGMRGSGLRSLPLLLLFVGSTFAQDAPKVPAGKPAPEGSSAPAADEPVMVVKLREGSTIAGRLSVRTVTVTTEFGALEIPVERIAGIVPGLDRHPDVRQKIGRLVQQLGANTASERDAAQEGLLGMGAAVRPVLRQHLNDQDAERRTRVRALLADLDDQADQDAEDGTAVAELIAEDRVETDRFAVVGRVTPQSLEVRTRFGALTVTLEDVERIARERKVQADIRKSVTVTGTHLAPSGLVATGIRVSRGDRIEVVATGTLTMSPWGDNARSTPDGSERYNWYLPGQIPGGMLVGRIGNVGQPFPVGSRRTIVAEQNGMLMLGVGISPDFAGGGTEFPGEYKVKLVVSPKAK
jgi:hypothetical protein